MALRQFLARLRNLLPARTTSEPAPPAVRWHSVWSCREYALCPRRYRFSYVERVAPDRLVPDSWRYGTVVHRALEAAYRLRVAGAPTLEMEEAAVAALHRAWETERLPDDDATWRDRAERLVRRTVADELVRDDDILGVEHRFSTRTYDGIAFTGYADLVLRRDSHTVEIVDHKITRNVADRRTLKQDQQLNLYGWLAQNEWPWARRVLATHHYPPASTTVTVELTEESMESTMRDLARTARRAAADVDYRPTPGVHCGHCPWAARCPDASC